MASYQLGETNETSANWNVAKHYSELKILKHLLLADEYETIATFGVSNITENFGVTDYYRNLNRILSLNRLAKEIEMIINNSYFAMKKDDKKKTLVLKERLLKVMEFLPNIEKKSFNQLTNITKVEVNESMFNEVLKKLIQIKTELNEPLNDNNLIYGMVDEFDPDKAKENFMNNMINRA